MVFIFFCLTKEVWKTLIKLLCFLGFDLCAITFLRACSGPEEVSLLILTLSPQVPHKLSVIVVDADNPACEGRDHLGFTLVVAVISLVNSTKSLLLE